MGLIIEKTAILASTFTLTALLLGLSPLHAFLMGGVVSIGVVRLFLGGKTVSQTGLVASGVTILAFYFLGVGAWMALVYGIASGYVYLYSWLLVMPRLLR